MGVPDVSCDTYFAIYAIERKKQERSYLDFQETNESSCFRAWHLGQELLRDARLIFEALDRAVASGYLCGSEL